MVIFDLQSGVLGYGKVKLKLLKDLLWPGPLVNILDILNILDIYDILNLWIVVA